MPYTVTRVCPDGAESVIGKHLSVLEARVAIAAHMGLARPDLALRCHRAPPGCGPDVVEAWSPPRGRPEDPTPTYLVVRDPILENAPPRLHPHSPVGVHNCFNVPNPHITVRVAILSCAGQDYSVLLTVWAYCHRPRWQIDTCGRVPTWERNSKEAAAVIRKSADPSLWRFWRRLARDYRVSMRDIAWARAGYHSV